MKNGEHRRERLVGRLDRLVLRHDAGPADVALRSNSLLLGRFLLAMIAAFAVLDTYYSLTVPRYRIPWYGYFFLLTSFGLNRGGWHRTASWLVMAMFPITILVGIAASTAVNNVNSLNYLFLSLVAGGILLRERSLVVFILLEVAGILLLPWLVPRAISDLRAVSTQLAIMIVGGALVLLSKRHRDAIERERQAQLREAERKYRSLIETTDTGYVILDDRGRVLDANQQYVRLTGRTRLEDVVGRSVIDWTAPHHREHNAAAVKECLARGFIRDLEIDYLSPEGKVTPIEVNATVLRTENSLSVLSLCRDITERKRVEAELESANRTLAERYEQLKKVDAIKDGLLRDVTHELKTPVAKQAMQIELLRSSLGKECLPKVDRIIQVMERSVRRQELVIRNLLDLSRLEEGGRRPVIRPVRLDDVLDSVLKEYRASFDEVGMEVLLTVPSLAVRGDEEMLWHVFSNLFNNAMKFRKKDGPGRLEISGAPDERMMVLRFRDFGIGLGPEELKHVFERFYQASPSTEGSGVGLTICRMVMAELGGTIALESDGKGTGATAVVSLPLA